MIYADTSALAKLIINEVESEALKSWLLGRGVPAREQLSTNVIGVVELYRVASRWASVAATATMLLARIDKRELTPTTLALASEMPPPQLRTLDALHIASAAELPELSAFVTYDDRLATAAAGYGLPVVSPR